MGAGTTAAEPAAAIEARGLVKTYGPHRALDGFDLQVDTATVCGLLGPNGAGKTTAVRILASLLRADGGSASVAGVDVAAEPQAVRARIGLSGQTPAVDEILSGRQNLVTFGRLHRLPKARARARADELLAHFDLLDAASKSVKHYSGGMRRRLDLAVTLISAPAVLFLDEPTTGLDPRSRSEMWSAIRALVAGGTTVLLTTQYLDEADHLADQVVVMDRGRAIAHGSPEQLKRSVGADHLDVTLAPGSDLTTATALMAGHLGIAPEVDTDHDRISVAVTDRVADLAAVLHLLSDARFQVTDIGIRRPTLDDVFLRLTGRRADDGSPEPDSPHEEAA